MSGSSLVLKPSKWRCRALLLAAALLALLFLLLPLTAERYLPAWLVLTAWFYLLWQLAQQPLTATMLQLNTKGELRWFAANLPAGQLQPDCLLSRYALQLSWRDQDGKSWRRWLFADQLSDADYRALARQIRMLQWQQPTSASSDWR